MILKFLTNYQNPHFWRPLLLIIIKFYEKLIFIIWYCFVTTYNNKIVQKGAMIQNIE